MFLLARKADEARTFNKALLVRNATSTFNGYVSMVQNMRGTPALGYYFKLLDIIKDNFKDNFFYYYFNWNCYLYPERVLILALARVLMEAINGNISKNQVNNVIASIRCDRASTKLVQIDKILKSIDALPVMSEKHPVSYLYRNYTLCGCPSSLSSMKPAPFPVSDAPPAALVTPAVKIKAPKTRNSARRRVASARALVTPATAPPRGPSTNTTSSQQINAVIEGPAASKSFQSGQRSGMR